MAFGYILIALAISGVAYIGYRVVTDGADGYLKMGD